MPRIKQQTIYVPYEKPQDVFEREGRGVFLPFEQFECSWNGAKLARKPIDSERSLVDAIFGIDVAIGC